MSNAAHRGISTYAATDDSKANPGMRRRALRAEGRSVSTPRIFPSHEQGIWNQCSQLADNAERERNSLIPAYPIR
jgi:hypothetical protein